LHGFARAQFGNAVGKIIVKFLRDIAGQFQMLFLILAHRHMGGAIGQNISRH